jgi:hypothetical protein
MKIDVTLELSNYPWGGIRQEMRRRLSIALMVNMVYNFILESANADLIEKQQA